MRKLIFTFMLFIVSSISISESISYLSSDTYKQKVSTKDISSITIQCYCSTYSVVRKYDTKDLTLNIWGTFSIGGYQGFVEDAGAAPLKPEQLSFAVSNDNGSLTLSSPEWSQIHHALLIDKLEVHAPLGGMHIKVEQLKYTDLEGRNSE